MPINWPKLTTFFFFIVCSWVLFLFLDRLNEKQKERGLGTRPRLRGFLPSEADEYRVYTWGRYIIFGLLSNGLSSGALEAFPGYEKAVLVESRFYVAIAIVVGAALFLHALDRYWERQKRPLRDETREGTFRIYWYLRYPFVSLITACLTKFAYVPAAH